MGYEIKSLIENLSKDFVGYGLIFFLGVAIGMFITIVKIWRKLI